MYNPIRLVKEAIAKREAAKELRATQLQAARASAESFAHVDAMMRRMNPIALAQVLSNGSLMAARAQFEADIETIRTLTK